MTANIIVGRCCISWFSFELAGFDIDVVRRTWRAALQFFALWVCINVISVQVPRLIIFANFGAAGVSVFAVFVTYTRATRLFSATVSQAAQAEIGRSYVSGGAEEARQIIEQVLGSTIGITLVLLVCELIGAPVIMPLWTNGQMAVNWGLLAVLAAVALVGAYSDALMISLSALNKVGLLSLWYGGVLGFGVALGITLARLGSLVAIVGACLLLPELAVGLFATQVLERSVGRLKLRVPQTGFWFPFGRKL